MLALWRATLQLWSEDHRRVGGGDFCRQSATWMKQFNSASYCWWLKSCTSWCGKYPTIYRVSYIPGGAGFQPSTVVLHLTDCDVRIGACFFSPKHIISMRFLFLMIHARTKKCWYFRETPKREFWSKSRMPLSESGPSNCSLAALQVVWHILSEKLSCVSWWFRGPGVVGWFDQLTKAPWRCPC